MKATLFALAFNELLGFVRLNHSAFPQPSMLILSFDVTSAAWRFILPKPQRLLSVRGSEHSGSVSLQDNLSLGKDSGLLFQCFEPDHSTANLTLELTRRHITSQAFNLADDIQAHSARVQ